MEKQNRVKRNASNDNNKLLYDPNDRLNRRLGVFSMPEEVDEEEETQEEVEDEIIDEDLEETETTEQNIENNNQPSVKQVPQKSVGEQIEKKKKQVKFIKFLVSNPWIIVVVGAICFLLMLIVLDTTVNGGHNSCGLNGYDYLDINYCEQITVTDNAYAGTYDLEDYVAGVIATEVGMFENETMYEVAAITARTYALRRIGNSKDCSIPGNETAQAFADLERAPYSEERIAMLRNAAEATRGLVLTMDNSLISTQYDAFCWDEKDDDYYYLCQKDYDTNEPLKVPVEWANEYVARFSGQPFLDNPRYRSHGQGMSQDGALYLATELEYDRDEILSYFYGSKSKIMSIYETYGYSGCYSGEYPIDPDDEMYQDLTQMRGISIQEVLATKGMSTEDYRLYLQSVAEKAGPGTREAVIASAVSLIGSLAEMGYRLPYQWGGKYDNVGINENWGEPGYTNCDTYAAAGYTIEKCLNNYKWQSLDCSGFVNWALINGFQHSNFDGVYGSGAYQFTDLSRTISLDANAPVCEPGDVIVNEGHIVLVIAIDEEKEKYIVAESNGAGVHLSYYNYDHKDGSNPYYCRKLDYLYDAYQLGGNDD